jgi:hypothetical protein
MRTHFIFLLSLTSCVVFEADTGIPERDCGKKGATPDDGRCHCDSDCKPSSGGTYCLSEYEYGWPGGSCVHGCKEDAECSDGFICDGELCYQRCTTTSDCVAGRICQAHHVGRPVPLCLALCDEDADCDNMSCNVYSGSCLLEGEAIRGGGLNAPCKIDGDCRSDRCGAGDVCITSCDMSSPHCPEGGICTDGWCENACMVPGSCRQ